jgi:H-NS histone family
VKEWEYRKIDLNQQHPRRDDLDLLNVAGGEGWELVGIMHNNIAYLKRPLEEDGERRAPCSGGTPGLARDEPNEKEPHPNEVKEKYRDPVTGETWSGRGRMANWLKRKQDAGEDIEKYRLRGTDDPRRALPEVR